jgi:hypothetical protein
MGGRLRSESPADFVGMRNLRSGIRPQIDLCSPAALSQVRRVACKTTQGFRIVFRGA